MANLFTRLASDAGNWMAEKVAYYMTTPREQALKSLQNYYEGNHPAQLRVKQGQDNDNLTMNWIGLAVDRAVSMLVGGGVEFKYPEEAKAQGEYIDRVWDANKRRIFLHDDALDGATWGTVFIKIVPDGIRDLYTNEKFPRLVLLDPKFMSVETSPMDKSEVEKYVMQFKVVIDGKEHVFKEITRHSQPDDFEPTEEAEERDTWLVEMFEYVNGWQLLSRVEFPYDFPPIHHNKNLPSIHSVYGMSDIEQIINAQDKYNFVTSNNLKINRYHAHPKQWATGFKTVEQKSWGSDEMLVTPNPEAKFGVVEMSGELIASRAIAQDLRQGLFDLARQLDISSITDKVGQLTNFGLRLLYSDAIAKTETKKELYGEAFREINRRLAIMAGQEAVKCEVVFGSVIPINELEEINLDQQAIDMGIVDKQTVAEKWAKRYGQDWETIQERIQQQKAGESNIGSILLQRFNQGQ